MITTLLVYVVSVSASEQAFHFEPMLIEKWPLIQAFALEGFGR